MARVLQEDFLEEDSAVCSTHFLMNDLLKTRGRCQLRAGAEPILKVCRICLKTEGLMLSDEVRLPQSVCPECCSWLLECERLKSTSLRSHLVLQQILNRHGCITVESINKFHSPVSLDTTHRQTDQCDSHNEAVIKDQDAQTDRQAETMHTSDVDEYIVTDVIKEESDNIMNLDIVKDECDIDDTDKVTDDDDYAENSVVDNVLDLQETAADPLKIENECINEADVNKQSDNDEMEHGTGFSDEDCSPDDLSLRELPQTKTPQHYNMNDDTRREQGQHLIIHSKERPNTCNICQKWFTKKCDLTRHLKIHSGERPYACNICQKRFTDKSDLTRHLKIHSGERPYTCEICQKKFSDKSNLTKHLKTHSGERSYTCNICQKRFSQKANLTKHLIIHSRERRYAYDICVKNFLKKSHLTKHLILHSREKP